ncbi:MAG: electron transport complex, RnfABCDGE type, subunit [Clostridiales bacterium]|jgi:Na+-translocating ferredoxin:NAD+ oxidoreductase RNF subunit RnfB|nr:electron transport complex, RnfABCDGE type, subunit [Clostridiales bacterium]
MDITQIIIPTLLLGGIGLVLGLILGVAAKVFGIKVDEKITIVRDLLPGANCGACGYAGCDQLAKAIAEGKAPANACPVSSAASKEQIAQVMGVVADKTEKQVAFVKCNGTCEAAKDKYEYIGVKSCKQASLVPGGGQKSCGYGCLGFGDCVKACQFDAITIVDGIAVIDETKCTSCTQCVVACPKSIIEMVPASSSVRVRCNSLDAPKASKDNCSNACIGCKICIKQCPVDAITVENFLSHIDYSKCIQCGKCAEKCPTKCINIYE